MRPSVESESRGGVSASGFAAAAIARMPPSLLCHLLILSATQLIRSARSLKGRQTLLLTLLTKAFWAALSSSVWSSARFHNSACMGDPYFGDEDEHLATELERLVELLFGD